jgi:hypothetical protein
LFWVDSRVGDTGAHIPPFQLSHSEFAIIASRLT